jgi:hypothetical protein
MSLEKLNKIISKFRENRESISAGWTLGENFDNEKEQNEFVRKYSLDNFKKLSLENYAEGKTDSSGNRTRNNFCSELSDLDQYGRLGGRDGPGIYGIYIQKDSQKYVFPLDTNRKKELFAGKSPREIYSIINKDIIEILESAKTSNFNKLSEQNVIDSRFKSKILAVYFPEKNLMIHANSELSKIAVDFNLFDKKEIKKKSSIEIQQSLLKFKESQQNLKDLNNLEYSHILWYYTHGDEEDLKVPVLQNTTIVTKNIELLEDKKQIIFFGPPGTGKTRAGGLLAKSFIEKNTLSARDFEMVGINKVVQNAEVNTFTDDEYQKYVLDKINVEAQNAGFTFTQEENSIHLYSLKKNDAEIRIGAIFSGCKKKKAKQPPADVYLGVPRKMVDFLSKVPTHNRYLLIINCSVNNFILLPYEIEQKFARFVSGEESGKWDKNGKKQHAFHVTITNDTAKLPVRDGTYDSKYYDCEKFTRNIKMMFGNFIRNITFHPSYSYEEFVEGIRPKLNTGDISYEMQDGIFKSISNDAKNGDPNNKYILFIDEINRGNISKIFGELITLIENDKRDTHHSTLTYTKESFTVPKNLYIIGTMNTADKSLSLLDVALRRRFGFIELMPDYDVIDEEVDVEGSKFQLSDVLEQLNKKIKRRIGRERQIGHSYFMKYGQAIKTGKQLQSAFVNEIVPLLQEYLYEDNESLLEILGEGFVDETELELDEEWKKELTDFKNALLKIPKLKDNE